ncbi:MAG TPA: polysaccharide biosynthesis/export family protein [Bryobacteraceae bacterium]|jgi:polysaccharide export outer membrane protein
MVQELRKPRRPARYAAAWLVLHASLAAAYSQPAGAPTPGAYVLGTDDLITIQVLHVPEITDKPLRIGADGSITLPLIGRVQAAGLSTTTFQDRLATRFGEYLQAPEVSVAIAEFRSQPISVAGSVNTPGVYQLQSGRTLLELLSLAGGAKADASDTIRITRRVQCKAEALPNSRPDVSGQFVVGEVSLRELLEAKGPGVNVAICPGDAITVARAHLVYVLGEVHKPGGFILVDKEAASALEAISMSEGLLRTAAPTHAVILRPGADGQRQQIPVNLKSIMQGKEKDVTLHAEDILVVPDSMSKNALARTLEAAIQMGTGVVVWGRY